jgi:hypothetical protein
MLECAASVSDTAATPSVETIPVFIYQIQD